MTVLITGAAGFIGFHAAKRLLEAGTPVIGVDNLNTYYDPRLKQDRLAMLKRHDGFTFHELDIAEDGALEAAVATDRIDRVLHLAAEAGVRFSLENPRAFARANLVGHLNILEFCRNLDGLQHLVYASSSSVYGCNTKVPFSEEDFVDRPASLYAATKKADELMSFTYSHLFGIPQTGLRFFTVYGPWGRPDMAYWIFAERIVENRQIEVFNFGEMHRDFTYIDDAVQGILAALDRPPSADDGVPHQVYNIGSDETVAIGEMIAILEGALGRKARKEFLPMPPGDVPLTYADITASRRDLGFVPRTSLTTGLENFVAWYEEYRISAAAA